MSPLLGLATIVWELEPSVCGPQSTDTHKGLAYLECLYLLVLQHCLVVPPEPCIHAEQYKCARYGEDHLSSWSANNAVHIVSEIISRLGPYLSCQHEPVVGHEAVCQHASDIRA